MSGTEDPVCAHFRVCGQVQGVFFRAATRDMARRCELTGWVRNCDNGEVELIACGSARQLQVLAQWLLHGPATAQVTDVRRTEVAVQTFSGFEIRY